jgi:cytochrome b561
MPANRYSIPAIVLHWTMALGILLAWGGMQIAEDLGRGPAKALVEGGHALFGLAVLALLLPRILTRLRGRRVAAPDAAPAWEACLAAATHLLLYAMMLALPVSGLLTAMTGRRPFDLAGLGAIPNLLSATGMRGALKGAHELIANGLIAVVALHVAATLFHAFIRRDDVAARMIPGLRRRDTASRA